VYDGTVIIGLYLNQEQPLPASTTLNGTLSYQGCDNEVCLIPMETGFSISVEKESLVKTTPDETEKPLQYQTMKSPPVKDIKPVQNTEEKIPEIESVVTEGDFQAPVEENPLGSRNFFWVLILVFLGGLALNLTPCV